MSVTDSQDKQLVTRDDAVVDPPRKKLLGTRCGSRVESCIQSEPGVGVDLNVPRRAKRWFGPPLGDHLNEGQLDLRTGLLLSRIRVTVGDAVA